MYLLDTNVISELRKPQTDANVVSWAKSVIAPRLYISAITLKELETGVLRMKPEQYTSVDFRAGTSRGSET